MKLSLSSKRLLNRVMKISFYIIALITLALGRGLYAEEHPVKARLLADRDAVQLGQTLRLGVELRMQEGWHTYWASSGDAGMPTEVEWILPPGVVAGPLQWPLPQKYKEQGDIVVYGYADQTLLLTDLQIPADGLGDTLHVAADVSWLVCRELCIPGSAKVELSLPIGEGVPTHAALFERYALQVPGPLDEEVQLEYSVSASDGEQRVLLNLLSGKGLRADEMVPDFYPLGADDFEFRSHRVDGETLELLLRPYADEPVQVLRGVLVYALEGQEALRAGEVVLDLAGATTGGSLSDLEFARAQMPAAYSLWTYALLALLGGLILNLMPCVLPVISLKVLSIVNQAGESRARVRALGLAFAAGIVVSFAVLALVVVLLKSGGEEIGWGVQFQYPIFVVAMAALVFALALSLFGVFTIVLPGTSGSFSAVGSGESLSSSFFNGVLATVLATPCTAPFLGTALGFAFAQSAPVIFSIFICIGVGMALPYIALALEPSWTRFLPRPGAWMERFKQGMGFLLMATVLWLLWVLSKQIGAEGVVWTCAFLLGVALACWILGQWLDLSAGALRRWVVWGISLTIVTLSYVLLLRPVLVQEQALSAEVQTEQDALGWIDFSPAEVERRVNGGQTVFIDFTAEWCLTCKVNERVVLARDAVRDKFADHNVALIKADWTNHNPEITRLLRAFGRSGVPLYVIFPGGQIDKPLVLPEIITVELVLQKLDEAEALRINL